MKYRQLGGSDLQVSTVGLGTWAIGNDFWGESDDAESIRALQAGIDAGINLIDTAPAYGSGHSEKVVGEAIKGRRDKVILATKLGVRRIGDEFVRSFDPTVLREQLEESLRLLDTDVIDLYQIHWPIEGESEEAALELMERMREEGKIRYIGVSNFSVPHLEKGIKVVELTSLQPPFSLLNQGIKKDILPFCKDNNIGVLGYGSLAGGLLTGKFREIPEFEEGDNRKNFYPYYNPDTWGDLQQFLDVLRAIADEHDKPVAHVSVNWSVQQPGVTCALVGARTVAQAESNAATADWELSEAELRRIDNAYEEHIAGKLTQLNR